ncbi:unnamed protein product [Pleuronectes platessa]|uniref:Protein kinase domain-containing protein n=1 Tax=Pleuronectes platessa TaxID=8262 RepID=A0A9N7UTF3_PLEPL|nr:unnamed protein product [Pleuronectes platessa]
MDTKEIVALKIVSKADGQKELDILEALREIGQDKNNFVKFNGHHTHCDKILLEFEKLDKTLFDWLGMSGGKGRPLSEIQAITKQLLVSLTALKSLNLVHADIKPNNIMLVDEQRQPSKVKLIDFGLATRVSELETGRNCQIIGFRAPEVMLGLPLNEAMDMWALGCIVAYLYLGTCLYKLGTCKYQAMKNLVQINGQPNDNLLNSGRYTNVFFTKTKYIKKELWSLKEHCCCKECAVPGMKRTKSSQSSKGSPASSTIQKPAQFASLDDIVVTRPGAAKNEDTQAFLSLLKQMLHLDAKKRIDPSEALQHPFMTMKHFPSECVSNPDMPSAPRRERVRRLAGCNSKVNKTCVVGVKERYDSSPNTSKAEASPERARGGRGEKISSTDKRAKGDAEISSQKKIMKNFPVSVSPVPTCHRPLGEDEFAHRQDATQRDTEGCVCKEIGYNVQLLMKCEEDSSESPPALNWPDAGVSIKLPLLTTLWSSSQPSIRSADRAGRDRKATYCTRHCADTHQDQYSGIQWKKLIISKQAQRAPSCMYRVYNDLLSIAHLSLWCTISQRTGPLYRAVDFRSPAMLSLIDRHAAKVSDLAHCRNNPHPAPPPVRWHSVELCTRTDPLADSAGTPHQRSRGRPCCLCRGKHKHIIIIIIIIIIMIVIITNKLCRGRDFC